MNARRASATAAGLLLGMAFATAALAQKQGGVLRVQHRDSPASMSILEEGTISAIMPMMGVFNNLVLFDQHVPQNRAESIVPDHPQMTPAPTRFKHRWYSLPKQLPRKSRKTSQTVHPIRIKDRKRAATSLI